MMNHRNALFAFSLSFLLSAPLISQRATAAEVPIVSSTEVPQLRELRANKFATGSLTAEINGKKESFMTTSETITVSEEQLAKADPKARSFLAGMNGKVVDTAVLRSIAGQLFVTITAYGDIQADGPNTTGEKATSVKIGFALDPKTLQPTSAGRELTYAAPGDSVGDSAKTGEFDLKLASITKHPDGTLAFKGTFSGTMTQTLNEKPLGKPVNIKGGFDIERAGGNDVVLKLLKP